jgi:Glycosyl transferases group 1
MKLIVSPLQAWRGYISREYYYVMTELMANHGWRHIETQELLNGSRTMRDKLLEVFGELPKVILFWESYHFLIQYAYELVHLSCHKCIFADDLHWWSSEEGKRKFLCYSLCDTILSSYAYVFDNSYPQLSRVKQLVWVPHSASPDFMLRYNEHPENAILLSGSLGRHYPFREQLKRLHEEHSYAIAYHPHPGYSCDYDYDNNRDVGQGYAAKIHNYRVGFTDSSNYKYVVAKYFEIPATGALLLADDAVAAPLKELGLIEYEHYLPVSSEGLEEKIQYVLNEKNHQELDEMRKRGQERIQARHKTSDRARQIDEVCTA